MDNGILVAEKVRSVTYRLSGFYFFLFFGFGSSFPLLSLYLQAFGLSGVQIGTLLSAGPVAAILAQPVWGLLCDRFRAEKKILVIALVISAAAGLLFPAAGGSYSLLLILYVVMSLFSSAVVPIIDSMTLSRVQKSKSNYGNIRLFGALGFAVAVWVAGLLAEGTGLQSIFYLYAASFIICIGIAVTLPQEGIAVTASVWSGIGTLFRIPDYTVFLIAAFLIFGPIQANNSYFSLLYTSIGGAVTGVGTAFLLFAGSEAPVMRIAGKFAEKYGMLLIILVSAIISAFRWWYYSSAPTPAMVIALFFLQGMSVGLFLPLAASFIRTHTPPEVQVTAQAIYASAANGLGTIAASYLGGWLLDKYGILSVYQYFSVSSLFGAVLLAGLYLKRRIGGRAL